MFINGNRSPKHHMSELSCELAFHSVFQQCIYSFIEAVKPCVLLALATHFKLSVPSIYHGPLFF